MALLRIGAELHLDDDRQHLGTRSGQGDHRIGAVFGRGDIGELGGGEVGFLVV